MRSKSLGEFSAIIGGDKFGVDDGSLRDVSHLDSQLMLVVGG